MFYLLFVFKIDKLKVFFFLRNSVLCIWLSNEGKKHTFNFVCVRACVRAVKENASLSFIHTEI